MCRKFYVDGSQIQNPGLGGGYAVVSEAGEVLVVGETDGPSTNNREELKAVIAAVGLVKPGEFAEIHSDSDYALGPYIHGWLADWKSRGWRRVKNLDLVQQLATAVEAHEGRVTFKWVRGHDGHELQELADAEANAAARRSLSRQLRELSTGT